MIRAAAIRAVGDNEISTVLQDTLVARENARLREELARRDAEIAELRGEIQHLWERIRGYHARILRDYECKPKKRFIEYFIVREDA